MKLKKFSSIRTIILVAGGISASLCLLVLLFLKTPEETGKEIQESFLKLEKQASQEAQKQIERKTQAKLSDGEKAIFIHEYKNDSLIFWNTNMIV